MYEDKILICRDCGDEFIFTAKGQEFFKEKDFTEPKRCPGCRKARKQNAKEFNDKSRLLR